MLTFDQYRREAKRLPAIAKARKEIADTYRAARRENPAVARVLWRRAREAEERTIREWWSGSDQPVWLVAPKEKQAC